MDRQVVTKGKYVALEAERGVHRAYGLIGALGCFGCICGAALCAWSIEKCLFVWQDASSISFFVKDFLISVGGALLFAKFAAVNNKKAGAIIRAQPLTRANTADLPAPDSLVRASQEPAQAQETVLLRASTETHNKHEEQLLRVTAE